PAISGPITAPRATLAPRSGERVVRAQRGPGEGPTRLAILVHLLVARGECPLRPSPGSRFQRSPPSPRFAGRGCRVRRSRLVHCIRGATSYNARDLTPWRSGRG